MSNDRPSRSLLLCAMVFVRLRQRGAQARHQAAHVRGSGPRLHQMWARISTTQARSRRPDYTAAAMTAQQRALPSYRRRLPRSNYELDDGRTRGLAHRAHRDDGLDFVICACSSHGPGIRRFTSPCFPARATAVRANHTGRSGRSKPVELPLPPVFGERTRGQRKATRDPTAAAASSRNLVVMRRISGRWGSQPAVSSRGLADTRSRVADHAGLVATFART